MNETYGEIDINELQQLPRNFFNRDVETVAKALIGTFLFTVDDHGNRTGGKIVETEAYDQNDPAAHCYCPDGKKPLKLGAAEAMFLAGGRAYVYGTQFNWCLNFVSDEENFGSAVLIRAVLPMVGIEKMRERHKQNYESAWTKDNQRYVYSLCQGPGNLCVSLGITDSQNKQLLWAEPFDLRLANQTPQVVCGRRVRVEGLVQKKWASLDQSLRDHAIGRARRFADSDARDFLSGKAYPLSASQCQ